ARLAQYVAVDDDDGIAADHHRVGLTHYHRLLTRQPLGVGRRRLAVAISLVDVRRAHLVLDPHEREQVPAPRRGRRENDARANQRSSQMVTGPSFTESTSIMAPNSPVSVRRPRSRMSATNRSYNGIATSGLAASMKLGRRPLTASP